MQDPGEYSIYNNIPYDEQIRTGRGFANPENNHYSFYDGEVLVGFINLREVDDYVHFGIGVVPDLCGQGYGQQIVGIGKYFLKVRIPSVLQRLLMAFTTLF